MSRFQELLLVVLVLSFKLECTYQSTGYSICSYKKVMSFKSFEGDLSLDRKIANKPPRVMVSNGGGCFRLLLQLYPASAGVKNGHLKTPYDLLYLRALYVQNDMICGGGNFLFFYMYPNIHVHLFSDLCPYIFLHMSTYI
jgi:hypothetical protein